ncbi:MAG TPA: molybdopterin-guanine dinucleotide biosynthesis protein B [Pasteurellaceae bacterium]|nr:molybdopterin-guanine dinucleotide biosynthesis protein B [Pasteurellaceae bacterium]
MLPILGITGYSGSGKTTLLEKLIPQLNRLGLKTAVIKHCHHDAHTDKEGKDSWRMKEAGAGQVIMTCDQRWALMTETPKESADLQYLSRQFDENLVDLVLVEGFKQETIPKIVLHRQAMTKSLPEIDENVVALATDYTLTTEVPVLDLNNIINIADFIFHWYQKCG